MITVGNKYHGDKGINVMRPSPLGNPFIVGQHGERGECVELFRKWLWKQIKEKQPIYYTLLPLVEKHKQNEDLVLVCCCKPRACHADVLKAAIEWLAKQ